MRAYVKKLGNYKGLVVPKVKVTLTEEEVQMALADAKRQQNYVACAPETAAKNGDRVTIDYVGKIDDVAFEGGTGYKYPLVLGSGSFIPGFEEQLIGAKAGDQVEVKVTFPQQYHAAQYAGKDAIFYCTVHAIERAEEMSPEQEERLKEKLREYIRTQKEQQAEGERVNVAMNQVIEASEIDIPEEIVRENMDMMKQDLSRQLQSIGATLEQWFAAYGVTMESYENDIRPEALRMAQQRAAAEAIAELEDIELDEIALAKELTEMGAQYGMQLEEIRNALGEHGMEEMKARQVVRKAVELVMSLSVEG